MHQQIDIDMDSLLKKLWSIDESAKRTLTFDERVCEDIYKTTHSRDSDGRYIVKLPFKITPQEIGSTRDIALKRLEQLERRLENKPLFSIQHGPFRAAYNLKELVDRR
ncbi:unnamed protein product [Arctia plantaginis]|uniref:Uncharacterized protein n=1 Tax=Arctia plantaginis TaxID=874455 RepID=A0A8S1AYX6_ARCPL|nr:unnamed protein product [Arctia plantaginis]